MDRLWFFIFKVLEILTWRVIIHAHCVVYHWYICHTISHLRDLLIGEGIDGEVNIAVFLARTKEEILPFPLTREIVNICPRDVVVFRSSLMTNLIGAKATIAFKGRDRHNKDTTI